MGSSARAPAARRSPGSSNLNTNGAGDIRPNLVVVPLGADGTVDLHLLRDPRRGRRCRRVLHSAAAPVATAGRFHVIQPFREVDTRLAVGFGRLPGGSRASIDPVSVPANAQAMAHNITIVDNATPGFVTPYPGATLPLVSAGNTTRCRSDPRRAVVHPAQRGAGDDELLHVHDDRPRRRHSRLLRRRLIASLHVVARLRIALAQLNPTVGDLDGNVAKIVAAYDQAEAAGCDIVAFPELAITGYPPEDLVLKPGFVADNLEALAKVAAHTGRCAAVVGFVDADRDLYNAAAVCANGEVLGTYRKRLLPNYAVFDEARYFTPGDASDPYELYVIGGVKVGISICEDVWSPTGPLAEQAAGGAELNININGSPYHSGKAAGRERMLATRAADASCALVYVNQVCGQDELVFDGGSMVFDADGKLVARAAQFVEELLITDVDIEPVYRKRLLDPRGRRTESSRCRSCTSPTQPVAHDTTPPARTDRAAARARRRAVRGARARHRRLRAQERLHRRGHRPVGWHRLDDRRVHRGRRARRRPRARRVDAVALLAATARRPTPPTWPRSWASTSARSPSSRRSARTST